MYNELYRYLVLNKKLPVPGIGTFLVERKPADIDFVNKLVHSPSYSLSLEPGPVTGSQRLAGWLAAVLNISEKDAVNRFNEFALGMREQVQSGHKLEWNGVGVLTKDLAGEIRFEPSTLDRLNGPAIPAVKVLRENASHTVRVGEDEMTSEEMIELLQTPGRKRSYFWLLILLLIIAAAVVIAWQLSRHGLNTSSVGYQQKVSTAVEMPTYQLVR